MEQIGIGKASSLFSTKEIVVNPLMVEIVFGTIEILLQLKSNLLTG